MDGNEAQRLAAEIRATPRAQLLDALGQVFPLKSRPLKSGKRKVVLVVDEDKQPKDPPARRGSSVVVNPKWGIK